MRNIRILNAQLCEANVIRDVMEATISPVIYSDHITFYIRWMGFVIPDDGSEAYQRIVEAVEFFGARWAEARELYTTQY